MGREADRLEPLATSYNTHGVYLRRGNNDDDRYLQRTAAICRFFFIIIIFVPHENPEIRRRIK